MYTSPTPFGFYYYLLCILLYILFVYTDEADRRSPGRTRDGPRARKTDARTVNAIELGKAKYTNRSWGDGLSTSPRVSCLIQPVLVGHVCATVYETMNARDNNNTRKSPAASESAFRGKLRAKRRTNTKLFLVFVFYLEKRNYKKKKCMLSNVSLECIDWRCTG